MKLSKKIIIGALSIASIVAAYEFTESYIFPNLDNEKFYPMHAEASSKYSQMRERNPTNPNIINFDTYMLKKHNARYSYDGLPMYTNGERVSIDSVMKWLGEYMRLPMEFFENDSLTIYVPLEAQTKSIHR